MTLVKAVKTISASRLQTYKDRFSLPNDAECLGLYIWNKKICGAFFPVLQLLEVSLRNAVHQGYLEHEQKRLLILNPALTNWSTLLDQGWFITFFKANKLTHKESFRHISAAEYALSQRKKPLTIDNIIAKLPYGFWAHICSKYHDEKVNDSLQLWPKNRNDVFPAAIRGGNYISMDEIQKTLQIINDIRNRIAHHEPIWHASHLYDAPTFINKVVRDFATCLDVIGWINPSNLKTLTLMACANEMAHLCNITVFNHYRQLATSFGGTLALDSTKWRKDNLLNERHEGQVVNVSAKDGSTIIKSIKDNKRFFLDRDNKPVLSPLLKVDEYVTFKPKRKGHNLFAQAVVRKPAT